MPYCSITLEPLPARKSYSEAGLRSIHPKLTHLEPLAYSYEAQLREVRRRSDKMSIQGVQPKLSAVLGAPGVKNQVSIGYAQDGR